MFKLLINNNLAVFRYQKIVSFFFKTLDCRVQRKVLNKLRTPCYQLPDLTMISINSHFQAPRHFPHMLNPLSLDYATKIGSQYVDQQD